MRSVTAAATSASASGAAVPVAGLAVAIAARAQAGSNQFDIRLDPPELGRIDVRLDVDGNGQVTTHVTVDRADTLQLLQSQQPQLERALEQAGLRTADNGLQFTLRDQSFAGQNGTGNGAASKIQRSSSFPMPIWRRSRPRRFIRAGPRQRPRYPRLSAIRLRTDHDDHRNAIPTTPTSGQYRHQHAAQAAGTAGSQQLAGNFDTFLQLLTTQLQNQDPLDPLDTNQFTQQLVEFASVEQQVDMNTNMQTLISLQQTSEATSAMQFLGANVTLSGTTAALSNATGIAGDVELSTRRRRRRASHHHQFDRPDRLYRHVSLNAGTQTYQLERPGQ